MLAGDPSKSSFACPGTNTAEINNLPPYNCPNGLRAQVFFPSCWNVKDLDTPDHISHMSYPLSETYNSGPCPADFPIQFISLFSRKSSTTLHASRMNGSTSTTLLSLQMVTRLAMVSMATL